MFIDFDVTMTTNFWQAICFSENGNPITFLTVTLLFLAPISQCSFNGFDYFSFNFGAFLKFW